MKNRLLTLGVLVILLVGVGIGYDRWRAKEREQAAAAQRVAAAPVEPVKAEIPPLPVWGSPLPAAEDVEVSGSAICGFCHWKEGGSTCNVVLQTSVEPGIVFVLPNQTRAEMEKVTGECAGGNYWVTARGTITQYNGRNYLLAKTFTTVKTK